MDVRIKGDGKRRKSSIPALHKNKFSSELIKSM
jgi:hypothetical protein